MLETAVAVADRSHLEQVAIERSFAEKIDLPLTGPREVACLDGMIDELVVVACFVRAKATIGRARATKRRCDTPICEARTRRLDDLDDARHPLATFRTKKNRSAVEVGTRLVEIGRA